MVGGAYLVHLVLGDALAVVLLVDLTVAVNGGAQVARQGVDATHAYPVQTAGNFVGILIEFTAGVEHGHDDLQGTLLELFVHPYGDAPAVVDGGDRVVLVDDHIDAAAVAGQVLVDRVVDHFPHQVVESPRIGAPDVHPGPFANGFEALQCGDIPGVIPRFRVQLVVLCHTNKSTKSMPAFLGFRRSKTVL